MMSLAIGMALWMGCAPPPSTCSVSGAGLGSAWRVQWVAEGCASDRAELAHDLAERVAEVEGRMGLWGAQDSELQRVRKSTDAVPVSETTWQTARFTLELAERTGGVFDPTVAPLVRAWGFYDEPPSPRRPSDEELAVALQHVGWQKVSIGRDERGPWIDAHDAALDLGAVLEGHTADRLVAVLASRGIGRFLVDVGGEVRVGGERPSGGPWQLGLGVEPGEPGSDLVIRLAHGALATSGLGAPSELDGVAVHPKLDPSTGQPARSDVRTVAVVAPDARMADGLATAVALSGADAGQALLEAQPDVEGLIFVDGEPSPRRTSGMGDYLR